MLSRIGIRFAHKESGKPKIFTKYDNEIVLEVLDNAVQAQNPSRGAHCPHRFRNLILLVEIPKESKKYEIIPSCSRKRCPYDNAKPLKKEEVSRTYYEI